MLGCRIVTLIFCMWALVSCESTKDSTKSDSNADLTTLSKRKHESLSGNGLFSFAEVYTNSPMSFVVDTTGSIYYMNYIRRAIMKIDAFGSESLFAGGGYGSHVDGIGLAATFGELTAIAIDRNNNLYVIDDNLLRKITPSKEVSTVTTFTQNIPKQIVIDSHQNIFYLYGNSSDSCGYLPLCTANVIMKYSYDGTISTFAGSGSAGHLDGVGSAASFNSPWALVVDSHDNLFVLDIKNYLVRKISPAAAVTTVAGNGQQGIRDGKAKQSKFSFYLGWGSMAVGPDDTLYIADMTGLTGYIRTLDSRGQVKTFCGSGSSFVITSESTCADTLVWVNRGLAVDRAGFVFYGYGPTVYKISDDKSVARSNISQMHYARAHFSAVKLLDGRVLVLGGFDKINVPSEIYDPVTNTWSIGPMPIVTDRTDGEAILLQDGRVLIGGGNTRTAPPYGLSVREIEIYDPVSNEFHLAAMSTNPRAGATFTLLKNGKVLILGGSSYDGTLHRYSDGELFDPSTETLSPIFNSMKKGRTAHAATLMANGNVMIAGGEDEFGNIMSDIEIFQVGNSAIVQTNGLHHPRYDLKSYLLPSNEIMFAGGEYNVAGKVTPSSAVESYGSSACSDRPSLPENVYGAASAQLSDGRVLLAGGDTVTNGNARNSIYVLNLDTLAFELSTQRMSSQVLWSQLVVLNDGKIMSIGGWSNGAYSKRAEKIEL